MRLYSFYVGFREKNSDLDENFFQWQMNYWIKNDRAESRQAASSHTVNLTKIKLGTTRCACVQQQFIYQTVQAPALDSVCNN